jgi:WD40 repeat protein
MRRFAALLTVLLPGLSVAQEKKDAKVDPIPEVKLTRTDPIIYEKEVEPIFANKCFVCHSGKELNGKLDLSGYEKLMKGGKHGPPIVAGKAAESLLYKLASRQMKPTMPPKDEVPLTPSELALVKLWIDQGAKPPVGMGLVRPKVVLTLPPAAVKPVRGVAISPDGKTVAAGRGNYLHLFKDNGEYLKALVDPNLKTADGKPAPAAHISLVESLAFSADGKTLASGSYQEVKVWDVEKGTLKQTVTGFADRVVAIHFSADGKYFATGGGAATEDGEVKIFDAAAAKPLIDIKPSHSDTVFGVCFSPDSTKLATSGADKFVKVWEVPSGKFLKSFEGHTHHVLDVGWKPDGKFLASGGADNNVKVWDYEKGEQARTITAHQKQITRLVFVGKTNTFLTASGDQSVKLWNVDNGGNQKNYGGGADFLYAVAASPDGKLVAAGGEEGVVRLYNGDSQAMIKAAYPPGEEPKKEEPKKK